MPSAASGAVPPPEAPAGAQPPGPVPPPPLPEGAQSPGPVPPPSNAAAQRFRVVGTEPFWGIRIEGDRLHFTTLEDQGGRRLTATLTADSDGVAYTGTDEGRSFELLLARAPCSDGMSDRAYAYTATFTHAGTRYSGCADEAAKF